jgi:O-antigen/teichoic acid export membrane protein
VSRLLALLALLRRGSEVSNAEVWRNRAAAITAVSALLSAALAAANAFGYDLKVSDADISAIAGGVVAIGLLVSSFLHVAADKGVGLPPGRGADPAPRRDDNAPADPGGSD